MRRHELRPRHRPSHRHQRWLYAMSSLLFITGAGWLVSHYGLRREGALGLEPHPSEVWWLRLHGASVIGFLMVFGALLPIHVIHNWRRHLQRLSGGILVGCIGLLAASGYGLYYIVSDSVRDMVGVTHWVVGILALAGFLWHILKRRQPIP